MRFSICFSSFSSSFSCKSVLLSCCSAWRGKNQIGQKCFDWSRRADKPVTIPVIWTGHCSNFLIIQSNMHCVKSTRIRSCSGPYFLPFELNTRRYRLSPRIQSKWGKLQTRITPNMDTFYEVMHFLWFFLNKKVFHITLTYLHVQILLTYVIYWSLAQNMP